MSHALMDAGARWIRDPRIILDLGARDCQESVSLSKRYPSAKVFAFECDPDSITTCRAVASAYSNITVVPLAAHNRTGTTPFFSVSRRPPPGYSANHGASSLLRASGVMFLEPIHQLEVEVGCVRIDDWAAQNAVTRIDVAWMDLQGAELMALEGMGSLINGLQVALVEVSYRELYSGQVLHPLLDRWMRNKGFSQVYHAASVTAPDWFGEAIYARNPE